MTDKQKLRKAAEKAGKDKWQAKKINGDFFVIRHGSYTRQYGYTMYQPIAEIDDKPVRDFVALANPATVLLLLDELEAIKHKSDIYDMLREDYNIKGSLAEFVDCQVKRITELEEENAYFKKRFKELDLFFGKNILVMQAAIIEWRATGNAKNALVWIYNALFGPGELPSEDEKDAQAYFNREYAPIDKELMELHQWFYECQKREKVKRAAGISVKGERDEKP